MIKIAAALGGVLAAAYLAVPEARAFVAASAPVLLALICPISMVIMMLMMRKSDGAGRSAPAEPPHAAIPGRSLPQAQPAQAKDAAVP